MAICAVIVSDSVAIKLVKIVKETPKHVQRTCLADKRSVSALRGGVFSAIRPLLSCKSMLELGHDDAASQINGEKTTVSEL